MSKFLEKYRTLIIIEQLTILEIIRLTIIGNISNYKLVLENCSFQYCLLTDVNIAHTDVNIDALITLSKQHGYQ